MSRKAYGTNHSCVLCGREIKKPRYWLHMTTKNEFVPADYSGTDSQGAFPVGSECKNRPDIKHLVIDGKITWK